ncbi:polysaccharide pyruvyl transferase family protein [Leifsonia aquatica]|uniref:polysaccharide pyruvyl transferase family protein n=1 Tax=Leifsonia aquatica TaxID=144185 RepID=UPI00384AC1A7
MSDEFFVTAFVDRVIAAGRVVTVLVDDRWDEIRWATTRRLRTIPLVLHPSRRLCTRSAEVAACLSADDDIVYLAADMLAGTYGEAPVAVLHAMSVLASAGARCHILSMHAGSVIDDASARRFLGVLAEEGTISVRDELTTAALAKVCGVHIGAIPDVGWTHRCPPAHASRPRRLVIVNPPSGAMLAQSPDAEPLPSVLRELVSGLLAIAGDADIGVLVHDRRQASGEEDAAFIVLDQLRARRQAGVELVRPVDTASMCRMLCAADLIISSRMHLSIHSLVAGRPTVTIGYGPKFRAALGGVQPEPALLEANRASLSGLHRAVTFGSRDVAAEVRHRSHAAGDHFVGLGVC